MMFCSHPQLMWDITNSFLSFLVIYLHDHSHSYVISVHSCTSHLLGYHISILYWKWYHTLILIISSNSSIYNENINKHVVISVHSCTSHLLGCHISIVYRKWYHTLILIISSSSSIYDKNINKHVDNITPWIKLDIQNQWSVVVVIVVLDNEL